MGAANVHRIRGEADPAEAAAAYERELRAAFVTPDGPPRSAPGGRVDLVLLGMGDDGHAASLFAGAPAVQETRRSVAWLSADLAAVGSPLLAQRVKASPTASYIFSYTAKLGALGTIRHPLLRSAGRGSVQAVNRRTR